MLPLPPVTQALLLANVAMLEGNFTEATAYLEKALRVDPGTPRAHERLALVALETGRPQAALEEIGHERRLRPGDGALDRALGVHAGRPKMPYGRTASTIASSTNVKITAY